MGPQSSCYNCVLVRFVPVVGGVGVDFEGHAEVDGGHGGVFHDGGDDPLGARGIGASASAGLGGVAQAVLAHSPVPVTLVRAASET